MQHCCGKTLELAQFDLLSAFFPHIGGEHAINSVRYPPPPRLILMGGGENYKAKGHFSAPHPWSREPDVAKIRLVRKTNPNHTHPPTPPATPCLHSVLNKKSKRYLYIYIYGDPKWHEQKYKYIYIKTFYVNKINLTKLVLTKIILAVV